MRRNFTKPALFAASLLLMGGLGVMFSLILSGIIGGISISLAPEGSLQRLERFICVADADLRHREGVNRDSHSSDIALDCISSSGTLAAIQTSHARTILYEGLFVLIFSPTFFVGAILMAVIFFG